MKKKVSVAVVCMMCLLVFFGCGTKKETGETAKTKENETQKSQQETSDIIPKEFAYAVTVSINPEVELYFDGEDVIVGIAYLNEDAKTAYRDIELVGKSIEDGVADLVETAIEKEFLKPDGEVKLELSRVEDTANVKDSKMLDKAEEAVKTSVDEYAKAHSKESSEFTVTVDKGIQQTVAEKTEIKVAEPCPTCQGKGVWCDECKGTTIVHCKSCHDTGYEDCGNCNGTGVDHGATCTFCNGAGNHICSWCHGTLQHTCPICGGNPPACTTCGGSGTL